MNPPVTHLLFDMDGLLLDTEIVYTRVTQEIVGRYGKTFTWAVKGNMIGRPAIEAARYLVEAMALPLSAEDYLAERNEMLVDGFAACDALPGAESLIRHLHRHEVPMAVATSSSEEHFRIKTTRHGEWFKLFDTVVTGDDPAVVKGKPAPDIFREAARRLAAPPAATLVFEDSPMGVEAGVAAGMRVVAIPDPNMDRQRYHEADRVLDSLLEFEPATYGLPAA